MNNIEKIRIIPKLEIKNQFLIKGMQFEGLAKVGNPIDYAKKYFIDGADQIFIKISLLHYIVEIIYLKLLRKFLKIFLYQLLLGAV